MNIYDFINSRDIAKYLKEINYQFSTLECAWLVWQSRKHTLKQKHTAWQEIIDTMPDCSVSARPNHKEVESLHNYLADYIKVQNNNVERFFTPNDKEYYLGTAYGKRDNPFISGDYLSHSTAEECIQYMEYIYGSDGKIHTYVVTKQIVDGGDMDEWQMNFNENKEILDIFSYGESNLFTSLWLNFPTPFEIGDILEITNCGYETIVRGDFDYFSERLVITSFYGKPIAELATSGCFDDMAFDGYYAGYNRLFRGKRGPYMDFERVKDKLTDSDNLLLPLSLHLKNKLNDIEMIDAYCMLTLKNELSHTRDSHYVSDKVKELI